MKTSPTGSKSKAKSQNSPKAKNQGQKHAKTVIKQESSSSSSADDESSEESADSEEESLKAKKAKKANARKPPLISRNPIDMTPSPAKRPRKESATVIALPVTSPTISSRLE